MPARALRRTDRVRGLLPPATALDVVELQAVRHFPSVSVLMTTTPGARMTVTDHTRLEDLCDQAVLRLRRLDDHDPETLIGQMVSVMSSLAGERTDQAIAVYSGSHTSRALRLGVPVVDRVVLDSTFATRDLVLALQRTPRHVVLMLTSREARLFDSVNGALQPAATSAFPIRTSRPRRTVASRPRLENADLAEFLRTVDRRLGSYRTLHPSPLVLAGPPAVVGAFAAGAKNAGRLAGTVSGNYLDAPLTELAALTRPIIQRYLASREQEALELVSVRDAQRRVAAGMQAAWLSSRAEQPEMLAVEQDLFYPARLSPDGHTISLDPDVDDPDVIDDAVDELIEHVLIRGGWVAFVGDGALARYGGVALTLR